MHPVYSSVAGDNEVRIAGRMSDHAISTRANQTPSEVPKVHRDSRAPNLQQHHRRRLAQPDRDRSVEILLGQPALLERRPFPLPSPRRFTDTANATPAAVTTPRTMLALAFPRRGEARCLPRSHPSSSSTRRRRAGGCCCRHVSGRLFPRARLRLRLCRRRGIEQALRGDVDPVAEDANASQAGPRLAAVVRRHAGLAP